MAPTKKAKKATDSINSRLALVMKSGKGLSGPSLPHYIVDVVTASLAYLLKARS